MYLHTSVQIICTLSDCNGTQIHNHSVSKRTLNHLARRPVWLNDWLFVYELSACGVISHCSHLNFRYCACFEQGISWHSGNYRVWIHSETSTWHDKNIQSICSLFICFELDGLLQSICFRMFSSKHSITFENMHRLSCWFHCVYIF